MRGFLKKTATISLLMLYFFGSSVNQMQIYKSCHIDFGFNDTVCDNLVTI